MSEEPTGGKGAKFLKKRDDFSSSSDEDSFQLTEAADQSGGHTLGNQAFEALIQTNCCFLAKEIIDNSKYP